MPLWKLNAHREKIGLLPLIGDDDNPANRTREKPSIEFVSQGTSLSEGDAYWPPGPGTELLFIYKRSGIEACEGCEDLARKMNRWGVSGCSDRVDVIVEDTLPRAREWVRDNHRIIDKLFPQCVKDAEIRIQIRSHVAEAIDRSSKRKQSKVKMTRVASKCTGCSRKSSLSKKTHTTLEPVSNLILSTTFGPDEMTGSPIFEVGNRPFVGEPTKNLVYHIYPLKSGRDRWKRNLDQLLQRIDIFDGRRIVAIAVDNKSDSHETVRQYLGNAVHEYLIYNNSITKGELTSFIPLISQLETNDPNQITFRAHAKGVSQKTDRDRRRTTPHLMDWADMLYSANLDAMDLVYDQLTDHAMTGACRKFNQFPTQPGRCSYSGSFYWFRDCYVYARNWREVFDRRFGVEEWPARMFEARETSCLFLDNTSSMYNTTYWNGTVLPSFKKWKAGQGLC